MSRDTDLFRFVELTMIVVFGVLLATVPVSVVEVGIGPASLLLVAALLLFAEAYVVLYTYHRVLDVPYDMALFVSDIVLVGLYAGVVRAIEATTDRNELVVLAMALAIVLFALLFVRQLGSYLKVSAAKLDGAGKQKSELITPMAADWAGVLIAIAILVVEVVDESPVSVDELARVAFVATLLYFVVKYLVVIRIQVGARD